MTAVKDVNRSDVGVEMLQDDDGDDRSGGSGRSDFVGNGRFGPDALKDSVVARLLLDHRPPSLQTPLSCPTSARSNVGVDVVRSLRSLPPPVDLSAAKLVLMLVLDHSARVMYRFRGQLSTYSSNLQFLT